MHLFSIFAAATLLFFSTTAGDEQLTAEDRTILSAVIRHELAEIVPPGFRVRVGVRDRTENVTGAFLLDVGTPVSEVSGFDVSALRGDAAYRRFIDRNSATYSIGAELDPPSELAAEPRLRCRSASGDRIYEASYAFSAPGFSPDGDRAVLYVQRKDCLSYSLIIYELTSENGRWSVRDLHVLREEGE